MTDNTDPARLIAAAEYMERAEENMREEEEEMVDEGDAESAGEYSYEAEMYALAATALRAQAAAQASQQTKLRALEDSLRGLVVLWSTSEPDNGEPETEFDKGREQTYRECAESLEAFLPTKEPTP